MQLNLRTLIGGALALALLTAPVAGAPARAADGRNRFTLDQALDQALKYSPKLKARREQRIAAGFQEKEAFTYFLPTLGASYSWRQTQNQPTVHIRGMVFDVGSINNYQWSTYLRQPIFTGFRIRSEYKLAQLGVDLADIDERLARLDLAAKVKTSYFEYLRAQKTLEVAKQASSQLAAHLKVSQDFHEVGIIPINDVLKTKVELANAQQREVKANNDVELARASLNVLLGRSVERPLEVEDILRHHPVSITFAQARAIARAERPELKALKVRLKQADYAVTRAQSGYWPQVSLQGAYNFTSDSPELGDSAFYDATGWEVSAMMDWPFWEWGRTHHQVSRQRAQKRRLAAVYQDLRDQVDLQVKQAYLFLRESEKNIVTARTSITQAKENHRITLERFKEQLTTNTELLDAQTLLTQAQVNYYTALTVFNVADAKLKRFMGRGLAPGPGDRPGRGGAR